MFRFFLDFFATVFLFFVFLHDVSEHVSMVTAGLSETLLSLMLKRLQT